MLLVITWGQYWKSIFIVLAIYYLALFILYYKQGFPISNGNSQLRKTLHNTASPESQPKLFQREPASADGSDDSISKQTNDDERALMPLVHDMVQEIKEFTADIVGRSYIKEEVIMGLQLIVKNYKKVEGSPYQQSVSDFIVSECGEACSLQLTEHEVRRIWFG